MFDLDFIGAPAFSLRVQDGTFVYTGLKSRLEQLTGLEPHQLIGRSPSSVFPPEIAAEVAERYAACVRSRDAQEHEAYYDLPGGGRWWSVTLTPVIDAASGEVKSLLGIAVDVTARRNAEVAAAQANARVALAMDVLDGGFWHLDIGKGEFRTSLPLARHVAGPKAAELGLEDYLSHIDQNNMTAADLSVLVAGLAEESVAEYRVRTFAGETRWMRCQRRLIRDGRGRPASIVGVAVDVTDQKSVQERYRRLAITDTLTGLSNRRSFEVRGRELIADALSSGPPFGVIVIDLDRFKPVNDRFGHAAGDAVLKEVATRIKDQMRDGDLVARLGGDEFAVLLDAVDAEALRRTTKRLGQVIAAPMTVAGTSIAISASLGTALHSPADRTLDGLVARADADMYKAKSRPEATVRVTPLGGFRQSRARA